MACRVVAAILLLASASSLESTSSTYLSENTVAYFSGALRSQLDDEVAVAPADGSEPVIDDASAGPLTLKALTNSSRQHSKVLCHMWIRLGFRHLGLLFARPSERTIHARFPRSAVLGLCLLRTTQIAESRRRDHGFG